MIQSSSKAAKEAFVAGYSGTTVHEVNSIVDLVALAALPACCVLASGVFEQVQGREGCLSHQGENQCPRPPVLHRMASVLVEFGTILLPEIGAMMGVASPHSLLAVSIFAAVVTCCMHLFWIDRQPVAVLRRHVRRVAERMAQKRTQFLSSYRGGMMLNTCIAILAVDFAAFPRRFVKSETFGTGLMDVGVGSFVVASGLVAGSRDGHTTASRSSLLHSLALMALGFVRLAATRGVDYQHPVSEYGVHWNFFFTLAAVKLLTTVAPVRPAWSASAGLLVVVAHQLLLSLHGGIDVVHADARGPSLLSLNKEGLLSLPGYWGLHLLSVGGSRWLEASRRRAAHAVLQHCKQPDRPVHVSTLGPLFWWLSRLAAATVMLWIAMQTLSTSVQPVSRRACNATYVFWMLAFNLQVLTLFAAVDIIATDSRCQLLAAANHFMLPLFLLANLLTGAVNLTMDTLAVGDWAARCIVTVYTLTLCSAAVIASERTGQFPN